MAQEKKIPKRRCAACREQKDKKELLRIVRTPEGMIMVDPTEKANGRGAYLCRNVLCLEKAQKTKALERSLKSAMPADFYELLRKEYIEVENG